MHNFVRFDQHPLGPDYTLRFAQAIAYEDLPDGEKVREALTAQGRELTWKYSPIHGFYARLLGAGQTAAPQWELRHAPSQLRLSETVDFAPVRVALWGVDHVCSPEIFVQVRLDPGQSQSWQRVYEFSGAA
jgi:hypothetical protein